MALHAVCACRSQRPSRLCPGSGGLLAWTPGLTSLAGILSFTQCSACCHGQPTDGLFLLSIREQCRAGLQGPGCRSVGTLRGGKGGTHSFFPSPGASVTLPSHGASAETNICEGLRLCWGHTGSLPLLSGIPPCGTLKYVVLASPLFRGGASVDGMDLPRRASW